MAMSTREQTAEVKPQPILAPLASHTSASTGLLQRKCACGGSPGADGTCDECRNDRLALKPRSAGHTGRRALPSNGLNFNELRAHAALPEIIQTQLTLSQAENEYEQEVDRVASQVMQWSEVPPQPTAPQSRTGRRVQQFPTADHGVLASAPESASPSGETRPTPSPDAAEPSLTAAEPTPETAAPNATLAAGMIVDDETAELGPGQMRKDEFLAELRDSVCATADGVLSTVGQSAQGCPYIEYWLGYYGAQSSQHIERAIRKYAPESAGAATARDYIPLIGERVRRSVTVWATTGEVTGIPEELVSELPAAPPMGDFRDVVSGVTGAVSGIVRGVGRAMSGIGGIFFKAIEEEPKEANPQAIQAQLGSGHSLAGDVKSRMESAFGHDFSRVRVHTDAKAAELATSLNSRAFTIGSDIAFGAAEYQPGTLIGDALLAHELAHVVQQHGINSSTAPKQLDEMEYNGLEEDADNSAIGTVVSLWGGSKGWLGDMARNTLPRLKSGLKLQRCKKEGPITPCCCCVNSVQIQNINNIDNATHMGHSFDAVISMTYSGSGSKSRCTLEWWEKTDVPYFAPAQKANTWHDMFALIPTSPTLEPWVNRAEPCPGNNTVTITDPPALGKTPGRTVSRTLEFRIVVKSGGGCTCGNASSEATAKQVLAMVNATPDWPNSSFVTPNP
jgi:hypothetical protein